MTQILDIREKLYVFGHKDIFPMSAHTELAPGFKIVKMSVIHLLTEISCSTHFAIFKSVQQSFLKNTIIKCVDIVLVQGFSSFQCAK